MDSEGSSSGLPGSDNQDSNEPAPPGTISFGSKNTSMPLQQTPRLFSSSKGVENAKKRLRAFSIQKKSPITPIQSVKPLSTGNNTVLIGKLSSVKLTPKVGEDDPKKPPRPPKPGSSRKNIQDSYTDLQKRTLAEIEDMKRKMELVELGIPLGLICPSSHNEKAMPTKAMPPIKSFLDASKVDEIIREAKKAKAEGREFKFDYQKLLPDYDNPFQRKKDDPNAQEEVAEKEEKYDRHLISKVDRDRDKREKMKRKTDRFDNFRRHSDFRKDQRERYKEKRREKTRERVKTDKREKSSDKAVESEPKETDVNLNDYLVCDSWSLDNDDKPSSPHVDEKVIKPPTPSKENKPKETEVKDVTSKIEKEAYLKAVDSPTVTKIEKLQPVIDSFKFEIDPNDEDILDMFDEDSKLEDYAKTKSSKQSNLDFSDMNTSYTSDSFADDIFMESVINEIKQEYMSDDDSQDKGLVEYDSPLADYPRGQGTPELDDTMRMNSSQRSDYAESYRSTDSGCKSTESGYKSTESGYKSTESGYKSTESGYKSTESGYKSTESGYKSTESCKYSERDKHKSRDKSIDSGRKNTERGLKSSEGDYKSSEKEYKSRDSGSKGTDNGHKSTESEYKSTDNVYKSTESGNRSTESMYSGEVEKEMDDVFEGKMSKETAESLEMWNFVLKICQPLLFRHDRSKCYKETRATPPVWWAERVAGCGCVRGRSVVTDELRAQRMAHVDRVYGQDQVPEEPAVSERRWYPPAGQWPGARPPAASGAGAGDPMLLDQEYQRFMQAVWPEAGATPERSESPDRTRRKHTLSEGWSQDSDVEQEPPKTKKQKTEERGKEKSRKRKRSSSTVSTTTDDDDKKKKTKKKTNKKIKSKLLKRARAEKKLKKLKEKQKKKKKTKVEKTSDEEEFEEPKKKKKLKKKQQKTKKAQKKKKAKAKSFSSSSSSSSSSDSDDRRRKSKKKKKRQDDVFDLNILNNIKTEKLSDDEKCQNMRDEDFSPRRQQAKSKEIINVKELQNDFVGVQIKQELIENEVPAVKMDEFDLGNNDETNQSQESSQASQEETTEKVEFKEPQDVPTPQIRPPLDEANLSQCSSQESMCSEEQTQQNYEKDYSHLRPSSQNSNYSFNDVIASQSGLYPKGIEPVEDKFEGYEQENYEMYEQLAMAYQSDVASNQVPLPPAAGAQRIETVALQRRGEIKCDWRAGDTAPHKTAQRSRWGLKPNEVNIVLTGGSSEHYSNAAASPVYQIESIANRNDNSTGYDEAYMDTYGAQDMLLYGDCFARPPAAAEPRVPATAARSTLDARIHQALQHTALGDMATEPESQDPEADKENIDKGILMTKTVTRGTKRVSFADGYKPGQDSDTEEPPLKKKKRPRRAGCAWPCPAPHPDHVPLWDALPPPPPPPGSPPPRRRPAPPLHLLRRPPPPLLRAPPHHKLDPNLPLGFMPPEPPAPGLLAFP